MTTKLTEPEVQRHVVDHPETWVDRYGDFLFRYAMHRLGQAAVAEDVVQETFLAALESRASFEGRSSFRTWVTSILRHKIADRLRQPRPAPDQDLEQLERWTESLFDEKGHWCEKSGRWPWPTSEEERSELTNVIERCLGKLPPQIAEVFVLHEQRSVPAHRLAASVGISTGNLWVRLYRARLALRKCLQENWFKASTE